MQHGIGGGDKAWDVESTRNELEKDLAARHEIGEIKRGILIGIVVAIIAIAAFASYSYIESLIPWEGKVVYPPNINCIVLNGTSNWTLLVVHAADQYELGSVKATILDDQIPAQTLLSEVPLSALTQANWTAYPVRYVKVNEELTVAVGADIIIDKMAYPMAHELRLIFQSKIAGQNFL